MATYLITYGHIIATWQILILTYRYKGISAKSAVNIASQSGVLGGSLPAKQGMKICIDYELVNIIDNKVYITDLAERFILQNCIQDEPDIISLRALLQHIVSFHSYEWLILYDSDPDIFRQYLISFDPEWTNILDNARLFNFKDTNVTLWWDKILSKYEDYKDGLKKAIGDVGEKLTYNHELKRIESDGYLPSKAYVKWAARIHDKFGFDILSLRGNYFKSSFEKKDKIQIEVKASDSRNIGRFRFFISNNEWKVAVENIYSYYFYCWTGINTKCETASDGPFVIPAINLIQHIPKNVSELCEWSECRCVIDLSVYRF